MVAQNFCGDASAVDAQSVAELLKPKRPGVSYPAAICRRSHKFPLDRASDGIRISSRIVRSFLLDLPRLSAKSVPSPRRESCSIHHSSVLRFVSLAFALGEIVEVEPTLRLRAECTLRFLAFTVH